MDSKNLRVLLDLRGSRTCNWISAKEEFNFDNGDCSVAWCG